MRLTNITEYDAFKRAIDQCKGDVWLESPEGDKYNLKSMFSQYLAIGAMLNTHGEELELYCQYSTDEHYFYDFFQRYPETL